MKIYTDENRMRLQKYLPVIRKVAGWTSEELGELIGVTKQTISNIENNRTKMTKTQYIAIRAMIDYEINTNKDNTMLAQIVNLLLDSEEFSEEDQVKIDTAMAYVTGAKEKGLSSAAIATGMASLLTALGLTLISNPVASIVTTTTVPLWLEAISKVTRKK